MKMAKVLAMQIGLFLDIVMIRNVAQKSDMFPSCLNKYFIGVLFTKLGTSGILSTIILN